MKSLKSILKVKTRTPNLLLLEVKPDSQITLIENGFDGNERLFRLQKNEVSKNCFEKFYTAFFGDDLEAGETYHWGYSSCTCASEEWTMQRNKILDVAKQFNFNI
jgi:hypothetical protein